MSGQREERLRREGEKTKVDSEELQKLSEAAARKAGKHEQEIRKILERIDEIEKES